MSDDNLHKFTTLFTNIITSHAKFFGWKVSIYNHYLPELNSFIVISLWLRLEIYLLIYN